MQPPQSSNIPWQKWWSSAVKAANDVSESMHKALLNVVDSSQDHNITTNVNNSSETTSSESSESLGNVDEMLKEFKSNVETNAVYIQGKEIGESVVHQGLSLLEQLGKKASDYIVEQTDSLAPGFRNTLRDPEPAELKKGVEETLDFSPEFRKHFYESSGIDFVAKARDLWVEPEMRVKIMVENFDEKQLAIYETSMIHTQELLNVDLLFSTAELKDCESVFTSDECTQLNDSLQTFDVNPVKIKKQFQGIIDDAMNYWFEMQSELNAELESLDTKDNEFTEYVEKLFGTYLISLKREPVKYVAWLTTDMYKLFYHIQMYIISNTSRNDTLKMENLSGTHVPQVLSSLYSSDLSFLLDACLKELKCLSSFFDVCGEELCLKISQSLHLDSPENESKSFSTISMDHYLKGLKSAFQEMEQDFLKCLRLISSQLTNAISLSIAMKATTLIF